MAVHAAQVDGNFYGMLCFFTLAISTLFATASFCGNQRSTLMGAMERCIGRFHRRMDQQMTEEMWKKRLRKLINPQFILSEARNEGSTDKRMMNGCRGKHGIPEFRRRKGLSGHRGFTLHTLENTVNCWERKYPLLHKLIFGCFCKQRAIIQELKNFGQGNAEVDHAASLRTHWRRYCQTSA